MLDLQDGSLPLNHSLQTALRRCRSEEEKTVLWADQICINQRDSQEQGQQLAIMSQVYSRADEVLAWLGESVPSDALAFWTLASLAKRPRRDECRYVLFLEAQRLVAALLEQEALALSGLSCFCCNDPVTEEFANHPSIDNIVQVAQSLLRRPYFTRLWPFQEIALSANSTCYCGRIT